MHWWPEPQAGEIVWCSFRKDKRFEPGPKPRPGLIIKVFDDGAPQFYVLIAYGTSQKTDQLRSGEFLIDEKDHAAYRLAGLSYPTKFNFNRAVELPYNDHWFKVPPGAPNGQVPRLGLLHPSLMRRAKSAWNAASK